MVDILENFDRLKDGYYWFSGIVKDEYHSGELVQVLDFSEVGDKVKVGIRLFGDVDFTEDFEGNFYPVHPCPSVLKNSWSGTVRTYKAVENLIRRNS